MHNCCCCWWWCVWGDDPEIKCKKKKNGECHAFALIWQQGVIRSKKKEEKATLPSISSYTCRGSRDAQILSESNKPVEEEEEEGSWASNVDLFSFLKWLMCSLSSLVYSRQCNVVFSLMMIERVRRMSFPFQSIDDAEISSNLSKKRNSTLVMSDRDSSADVKMTSIELLVHCREGERETGCQSTRKKTINFNNVIDVNTED